MIRATIVNYSDVLKILSIFIVKHPAPGCYREVYFLEHYLPSITLQSTHTGLLHARESQGRISCKLNLQTRQKQAKHDDGHFTRVTHQLAALRWTYGKETPDTCIYISSCWILTEDFQAGRSYTFLKGETGIIPVSDSAASAKVTFSVKQQSKVTYR